MFNNLKIGTKMILLSGTILVLLLATLLWGIFGLSKTVENGIQASGANKIRSDLLQLEIKHDIWNDKVRDYLTNWGDKELKVKLEHKTCSLGKWYYGEARVKAENLIPELKGELIALEEPHRIMHASGKKIKDSHNQQQALDIYEKETRPSLYKLKEHLQNLAQISQANAISDSKMIAMAVSTRTGISILGAFALLAGAAFALFITRSMTVPMHKTVSMIEDLENGHLDTRLHMDRKDEIGQLAQTMDRLADALQHEIVASLQKLANGDLTFEITPRDEQDVVRGSLKTLGGDLNRLMGQIQVASDQIASGSTQVSDSAQSLSQGATESAASLEEISSSMGEIGAQTNTSAENAQQANQLAAGASASANAGNERMTEMIGAMDEINEASQNISKIIKVIDEIAFQTNLLALNAAVEAARAGQHGKGFAVVAEEVRNLAARSAKAASETSELIEGSVEKVANGTKIAEHTAEALEEIVSSISKVTDLVGEIAAASNEQANGVSQVNVGLQQIDQVVQQSTANAEESAATSEELSAQAADLKNQLSHFKLRNNPGLQQPQPQLRR